MTIDKYTFINKAAQLFLETVIGAIAGIIILTPFYSIMAARLPDYSEFILSAVAGGMFVLSASLRDIKWQLAIKTLAKMAILSFVFFYVSYVILTSIFGGTGLLLYLLYLMCFLVVASNLDPIKDQIKRGVQSIKPFTYYFD